MDGIEGGITLPEHERASQARHDHLAQKIRELKINQTEESKMSEPVNVFTTPSVAGPGYGGYGGFGGDGMGGLLALALLGGGLNGRRDGFGVGDPCGAQNVAVMNAGFDGINHNINTATVGLTNQLSQGFTSQNNLDLMAKLGSIEGAIPLAEAQVQLAIAGSTSSINQNIANGLQVAVAGQANINKNISDAIASSLASQNSINQNVLTTGAALGTAIQNAKFELAQVTRDDGDKTRALIIEQNTTALNRQLTVAEAALLEERTRSRSAATEVTVSQVVNQSQAQAQAMQQQQQQVILLSQIAAGFHGLQNAIATNSNLIVGNTGAVATGPQTANPVNVKT